MTVTASVAAVAPSIVLPLPRDRRVERLARCIGGLALFGFGISLFLVAELGVAPWDVLHQGLSRRTDVPIGVVIVLTGAVLLLAWIPLRQRLGWGTLLNAAEIGLVVLLIGDRLPSTDALVPRLAYVAGGLLAIGIGSGLYIGAGLGSGPRDGLMLGLADRGISVRLARTAIESSVLVGGWALGGDIGLGTAVFALGIGPTVQFFLPLLRPREVTVSSGSARV